MNEYKNNLITLLLLLSISLGFVACGEMRIAEVDTQPGDVAWDVSEGTEVSVLLFPEHKGKAVVTTFFTKAGQARVLVEKTTTGYFVNGRVFERKHSITRKFSSTAKGRLSREWTIVFQEYAGDMRYVGRNYAFWRNVELENGLLIFMRHANAD